MSTLQRIALVTGREMAKPDPESHCLVAALAARGVVAEMHPWQDAVDWSRYPLVVVRTPWDYFRHREAFLDWADSVAAVTRLANPAPVLRWNSHKAYLRALAAAGVPVVPTAWLDRGSRIDAGRLAALGWPELVVKPAVSIGALGAMRARRTEPALLAHLDALLADGDVMVQPYLSDIAQTGELSLVYFGGCYSHCVRKRPAPGDYRVQDMYGGSKEAMSPPGPARLLADRVMQAIPAGTTYARIDLVAMAARWHVMEVELIEPELFLPLAGGAADRLADAILDEWLRAAA